jgi:TPR repeat protein
MIRAHLLRRAARRAMLCGAMFALGLGACASPPGHEVRTVEQLTEMANADDPGAQAALGQAYEKGLGVRASIDQALRWYGLASEGGDPFAPFQIGALYERGIGVEQDYAEAAHWYRIAAERGNDTAQASLAHLYEHGLGVPQDYAAAVYWYEAARTTWAARAEYPVEAAFATGREGADYSEPPPEALLFDPSPVSADAAEAADAPVVIGEETAPPTDPAADPLAALREQLDAAGPAMPSIDPGEVTSAALDGPDDPAPDEPAPEFAAHLASFRTADAAAREWDRLAGIQGGLFTDLAPWLDGVALGATDGEGFVRLLAAPFADRTTAERFCTELVAANLYCKVVAR